MNKSFISIKELAAKVGVSEKTIYRMLNANQIPSAMKIGGQWRFNINAVASWLASPLADETAIEAGNSIISVSSALHNGTVLYRIHGENRDEALEELLATLPQTGELDIKNIKLAILAQESLASSTLQGIACMRPGRNAPFFVDRSLMVMAYLEKPTDFKALDDQQAEIIVLTLPANMAEEAALNLRLNRMLMEPDFVAKIRQEMSRKELLQLVMETENTLMQRAEKKLLKNDRQKSEPQTSGLVGS